VALLTVWREVPEPEAEPLYWQQDGVFVLAGHISEPQLMQFSAEHQANASCHSKHAAPPTCRVPGACCLNAPGVQQAEVIRQALQVAVEGRPLFSSIQATWNLLEQSAGEWTVG